MKRGLAVLFAVLLGAIMTGIGVVPFLVMANQDRNRLHSELTEQQVQAQQLEEEKQRIADEANKRVEEANAEIERAQKILDEAEEDQRLIASADRLIYPSARETYRWSKTISVYQELEFLLPPKSQTISDNAAGISIGIQEDDAEESSAPWLRVLPYKDATKDFLSRSLSDTEPIAFVVDDTLLKGVVSTSTDADIAFLLEARRSSTSTHLIWISSNALIKTESAIKQFLATFDFND